MQLYLLFWTILGFIFRFYIIFGTNLLTGGPAQICCFMPILVFRGKGISNGVKMERNQLEKLVLLGFDPKYPLFSEIDVAMTLLCLMLFTRARVP